MRETAEPRSGGQIVGFGMEKFRNEAEPRGGWQARRWAMERHAHGAVGYVEVSPATAQRQGQLIAGRVSKEEMNAATSLLLSRPLGVPVGCMSAQKQPAATDGPAR